MKQQSEENSRPLSPDRAFGILDKIFTPGLGSQPQYPFRHGDFHPRMARPEKEKTVAKLATLLRRAAEIVLANSEQYCVDDENTLVGEGSRHYRRPRLDRTKVEALSTDDPENLQALINSATTYVSYQGSKTIAIDRQTELTHYPDECLYRADDSEPTKKQLQKVAQLQKESNLIAAKATLELDSLHADERCISRDKLRS